MRRVPSSILAVAGFATLTLFGAGAAFAQNPNQSSAQASVTTNPTSAITQCSPTAALGTNSTSQVSQSCSASGGSGNTSYGASATATATPGPNGTAQASASFTGKNPADAITAMATAKYYEYVTITGPIANIFIASVDATGSASIFSNEPSTIVSASTSASVDIGTIDPNTRAATNNIIGSGSYNVDFNNDLGGNALVNPFTNTQTFNTFFFGADLNGANEFYFLLFAQATVSDQSTNTDLFAAATVTAPVFTFYDENFNDITDQITVTYQPPVTATPEPASLPLLATGVAGLAGVARRKRRPAVEA